MNAQKKSHGEHSPNDADSGVRSRADAKKILDKLLLTAPRKRVYAVYHSGEYAKVHEGDLALLPGMGVLVLDVFGSRVYAELPTITIANADKELLLGHEVRIKQEDEHGTPFIVTISLYGTKKQAELKLQRLFLEQQGL
ncbi:MAG: hypothetical protein U0487_03905 [Patescibacteria group bacterium]